MKFVRMEKKGNSRYLPENESLRWGADSSRGQDASDIKTNSKISSWILMYILEWGALPGKTSLVYKRDSLPGFVLFEAQNPESRNEQVSTQHYHWHFAIARTQRELEEHEVWILFCVHCWVSSAQIQTQHGLVPVEWIMDFYADDRFVHL